MLLQITQICFYESDYVSLRSDMSIMAENGAKILVLSYYYLAPVAKVLFQEHHDRCCSSLKWLCIYFCCFNLLNHG